MHSTRSERVAQRVNHWIHSPRFVAASLYKSDHVPRPVPPIQWVHYSSARPRVHHARGRGARESSSGCAARGSPSLSSVIVLVAPLSLLTGGGQDAVALSVVLDDAQTHSMALGAWDASGRRGRRVKCPQLPPPPVGSVVPCDCLSRWVGASLVDLSSPI